MINKAMILAAGMGTRMRPITDCVPKPLVRVNGKTLIDYKLDELKYAGVKTVIVNVHYLADRIESHLQLRKTPKIIVSDERKQLMDSGGGILKALPCFDGKAFAVGNSDAFWLSDRSSALSLLMRYWDETRVDILMALVNTDRVTGFHDRGDFFMDNSGYLAKRGDRDYAPYTFTGDYIIHPRIFHDLPDGPFSSNMLFDRAMKKRRLKGMKMQDLWLHVGTPKSISDAEKTIAFYQSQKPD